MQTNGPLPFGGLLSTSWLLLSPLPALVNLPKQFSLCLRWMRSINAYNHHVSQALWLSMPLIKFNASISQQSKSIYSLLIEVAHLHVKAHMPLKWRRAFCILTSSERTCTDGLKLSHTAWFTCFCQAFTILRAMMFVHLFWEFSLWKSVCHFVLICLPVLSPHLDQFPALFADRSWCWLKHLAQFYPHEREDRTCQAIVWQRHTNL